MNPIEKFLRANYDVWEYASKGQSNFKCKKCGNCCSNCKNIVLMANEYKELRKMLPLTNFTKYRVADSDVYITTLKQPCPFLKDNKCSIFEESYRPYICKIFPLKLNDTHYPNAIQFKINTVCDKIKPNETVKLSYEGCIEFLKNCTKYFGFSNWREYQEEIKSLDEIETIYKDIKEPRTWCSVCNRQFKNPLNHNHDIPSNIQRKINYINYINSKFKDDKKLLSSLIIEYLKNIR